MSQSERGRDFGAKMVAVLILLSMSVMLHSDVVEAANYTIQWGANPDLRPLEGKNVQAGDTLKFIYTDTDSYNVIKVDIDRYRKCNGVGPTVYHSGNDTFELEKGDHYFICGAYDHCLNNGTKVCVRAN